MTVIPVVDGTLGTVSKSLGKKLEEYKNQKKRDPPNNSIVKIGYNPQESPRVIQT